MQTTTALGGSQRRVRRGTKSGSSRTQKEASLHNINNIIINGSGEARRDGTVRTTGNSSVATLKEEEIINSNSLKVHKAKMLVVVAFAAAAAVAVTVAINRQRKVLCVPHSSASHPATFTACAMAVQLPTSDWLTELSGLPGLRRLFAAAIVAGSAAAAAVSVCAGIGIAAIGIGIGNGNG